MGTNLRSIHASPLKRAWQTAKIISVLTGAPIHAAPGLMERKWGMFEGRPKSDRPTSGDFPTVETIDAFSTRILETMRSISGRTPLLVIAHSGVFRILARHAGFPIDDSITITSGHLLRFEPPVDGRNRWRIVEL